ncbi:uncharacterized protein LOC116174283 [Photinus pyralis]|uniref:uncharacterized protein LOC116174283 n=1 Tax=Photinus pyralis TaxID=7054 RepID=UPI0012677AEC|nr:uncharacterized protein LOC116174283 [Photinus pyralis]
MLKVVLIIGISGACRTDELTNLCTNNIQDKDDVLIVHIHNTKNYKERTFIVCNSNKTNATDVVAICKKYFSLRPTNLNTNRLFIKYNAGKCVGQNVGHHTIGSIPSKIASFLNLPDVKEYTGHCFRRTSTTLLVDSGADILTLKRHGGWKSSCVAEGYLEDSIQTKISVAKKILSTTENYEEPNSNPRAGATLTTNEQEVTSRCSSLGASTSTSTFSEQIQMSDLSKQGISFSNCTLNNPVFNITISNK